MLSPHRRHNIHKRNSDSSAASTDAVRLSRKHDDGAGSGLGLFSYFARARRRLTKSHRETDTLLPTTYASNPSSTSGAASGVSPRQSVAAITCNSFLMGGHYYPGKDKKRRNMRRRTLWYKVFCSSPCRKITSFLAVAYVLVWHAVLPLGQLLLQVGKTMSASRHGKSRYTSNWLLYDATLNIPDLSFEQILSVELAAARARLQHGSPQRNAQRLNLLGSIVPDWFHRNDMPSSLKHTNSQEQKNEGEVVPQVSSKKEEESASEGAAAALKPKETGEKKEIAAAKDASRSAAAEPHREEKDPTKNLAEGGGSKGHLNKAPRVLEASSNGLIERTIHTPSAEANTNSKCQALDAAEYSTTLVTQTSLSRLWILNETCTRWKDPIVVVVFIPNGQEMTNEHLSSLSCPNLQIITYMANPEESEVQNYPVNRLRNVGLDAVTTSHVMVMDVDFVPSMDLAGTIRKALQVRHEHHPDQEDRQALVVPAFERLPPRPCETDSDCATFLQADSSFIPKSFDSLQTCIRGKDCIVFQSDNNWEGHSTTRSEQWLQRKWYDDEEQKTTFTTIPCFHTARYEPYLVLRWCPSSYTDSKIPIAPYYDERFHGYGKNKIELVSHLRKKGYQFAILPEGFIVHSPHPESSIKETWNDRRNSDLHASMDNLYATFLSELDSMYKDAHNSSVKLCKHE